MNRIMISAMQSGSGKTVAACALMRALTRRGYAVAAGKCGPDYIDPMFHSKVLGVPSRNLDLFLQGEAGVRRTLLRQEAELAARAESGSINNASSDRCVLWNGAVENASSDRCTSRDGVIACQNAPAQKMIEIIEGAMGFFDGLGGTDQASAWQLADVTGTPVLLVLRPKGQSLTLAAQIQGMMSFRKPSRIAGLLLSDTKPMLYKHLKPILEKETGLPVMGYLPPMPEAVLDSRHLGLVTAGEIEDLNSRFDTIASELEKTTDIERIVQIASGAEDISGFGEDACVSRRKAACRIAVAYDEAFSFYYQDNLDALAEAGAELVFFSPIHDQKLPEAEGIYLGGGYPELYMEALAQNSSMRESIRSAVDAGMPAVAECGGFLYLQQSLEGSGDSQECLPMAGVLPGRGFRTDRLQRFGYLKLRAEKDSLLFRAGEGIPAHEFHYWDSTDTGDDLQAEKPDGRAWRCGFATDTLYAAFPHLHFGGTFPLAERFVHAAVKYKAGKCPVLSS